MTTLARRKRLMGAGVLAAGVALVGCTSVIYDSNPEGPAAQLEGEPDFASHTVHVLGRNLASVYEGLRDQTLDRVHMRRDVDEESVEPVVTNIYIRQATKNAPGFERLDEAALRSDDA